MAASAPDALQSLGIVLSYDEIRIAVVSAVPDVNVELDMGVLRDAANVEVPFPDGIPECVKGARETFRFVCDKAACAEMVELCRTAESLGPNFILDFSELEEAMSNPLEGLQDTSIDT
jgi:hypothetical protein